MEKNEKINYELLENGLDFVYSSCCYLGKIENDKSFLKYGILHLFTGLELILKRKLLEEDCKLLFNNSKEYDIKKFKSGDFFSVTHKTCMKRLERVCNIKLDDGTKDLLDSLRETRNKIEHFQFNYSISALKSNHAKVLNFIIDFIKFHLNGIKLSQNEERLFECIQEELTALDDFVEERMNQISSILTQEEMEGAYITCCPVCFQKALVVNGEGFCQFCHSTISTICDECNEPIIDEDFKDIGICKNCFDCKIEKDN